MSSRLKALIRGEFVRLNRYNLFAASFVVSLSYVLMAYFIDDALILGVMPFVFLLDSTMMTSLLVGATLFYEKKEHTVNSIMVTPAKSDEYVAAKLVASIATSLFTVVFVSLALYLLKGVTYGYVHVVCASVAVTSLHTMVGIRIAYSAKNFTSMLIGFMLYITVSMFPSILEMTGVIGSELADFLVVLPLETSANLMKAGFGSGTEPWKVVFGYPYIAALALVMHFFAVRPRFAEYMMKEMGV